MDRATFYFGALLRDTDLLNAGKFPMVGIAKLSEAVLGTPTCVAGFTLVPTIPASLSATLSAGQIYQVEDLEASQWGSMSPDLTDQIVKQGINLGSQSLTFTAPGTVGFAQNFLVEVQYQDVDDGSVVLPYFNSANPSMPFNGPGNAGTANNTVRQGIVAVQIKAGAAATSGTQTVPTPDAGWTGLFVVTVANGQTTVTSGNITQYSGAPFIPVTLPNVPVASQSGQWTYGVDTGAHDAAVVTFAFPNPIPTSLVAGMEILVKFAAANQTTTPTLRVNTASGNVTAALKKQGGSAPVAGDFQGYQGLVFDGTNWRATGLLASDIRGSDYAPDAGTTNNLVVTLSYGPIAYVTGMVVRTTLSNNITGASVINVNGLGNKSIILPGGGNTANLDYLVGDEILLQYNGTQFVCLTVINRAVIDVTLTFQVHGSGATFPDLISAMAWATRRRISTTGALVLNIPAGQFTYSTASLLISHPDLFRITISGVTVSTSPSYTTTGNTPSARASDAVTNLAMLRTVFATELHFTGGFFPTWASAGGNLSNILFTQDGTTTNGPSIGLVIGGGNVNLNNVATHGAGGQGFFFNGADVAISGVVGASACAGACFDLHPGASVTMTAGNLNCFGGAGSGINISNGSSLNVQNTNVFCEGNASNGVTLLNGANLNCQSVTASFNGGNGISMAQAGAQVNGGVVTSSNVGHGISVTQANFLVNSSATSTISLNGGWGINNIQGFVDFGGPISFSSNTSGPLQANDGANTHIGSASTGTTGASPALGTVGNNNSLNTTS